jgi:hypothetical protein
VVKLLGQEDGHSPPFSAKAENTWSCTLHDFMVWHWDKCTSVFTIITTCFRRTWPSSHVVYLATIVALYVKINILRVNTTFRN